METYMAWYLMITPTPSAWGYPRRTSRLHHLLLEKRFSHQRLLHRARFSTSIRLPGSIFPDESADLVETDGLQYVELHFWWSHQQQSPITVAVICHFLISRQHKLITMNYSNWHTHTQETGWWFWPRPRKKLNQLQVSVLIQSPGCRDISPPAKRVLRVESGSQHHPMLRTWKILPNSELTLKHGRISLAA